MSSSADEASSVTVRISRDLCCGAQLCVAAAPEIYALDRHGYNDSDGAAVPPEKLEAAQRGARICPEGAISLISNEHAMDTALPAGFAALEPFVAGFAVAGTADRARLRGNITTQERQAFYTAAKDLVVPALDLLDTKPVDAFDERDRRLLHLMLAFAHIALSVETQGPDEDRHTILREHMRIVRATAKH